MRPTHVLLAILLSTAAYLLPPPARAAQSYDSCTGFIDSLPAVIGTQGVWCLRKDLSTAMTSGNAIIIATNNVTIDCNDFKVGGLAAGNTSGTRGIVANGRQNATVRNCNVRGFRMGIVIDGGAGHLVEDNRVDGNLSFGIDIHAEHGVLRRNRVYDTRSTQQDSPAYGIRIDGADAIDNTVSGVSAKGVAGHVFGIKISSVGRVVRGNQVSDLTPAGGLALGIHSEGALHLIADNHVIATAGTSIPGYSIFGDGAICTGNTSGGFTISASTCSGGGGNHHY